MSSKEVVQLEKSWNVSVRRMFDLPRETHCYLIKGVSEQEHVRILLAKRFLNFILSVRNSKKQVLRNLLKERVRHKFSYRQQSEKHPIEDFCL